MDSTAGSFTTSTTTTTALVDTDSTLPLTVAGFVIALLLAFGIGANDVANSFGTSVGSRVLSIPQACCMATVFEMAGAVLIGYRVSDTMRKGILDVGLYEGAERELMLGCLSALAASAAWLLLATFFGLPISGTHSVVGATVGFSLVARGVAGVKWAALGGVAASWFVSPLLSGLLSVLIYTLIRKGILEAGQPLRRGLQALPLFYGATVAVNVFSVLHDGPKLLGLDEVGVGVAAAASAAVGLVVAVGVGLVVVPWQRGRIEADLGAGQRVRFEFGGGSMESSPDISPGRSRPPPPGLTVIREQAEMLPLEPGTALRPYTQPHPLPAPGLTPNSSAAPLITTPHPAPSATPDDESSASNASVARLFSFLQVLTAAFGSFAHGGNDVSNAIGPLVALWLVHRDGSVGQRAETPLGILVYGGAGIAAGLWVWGRRVIRTVGEGLTKITPTTGFAIEIGAASTVLLASKIGLPISTTHCKVGSVVLVGCCGSGRGVDWKLFRNIIVAWVTTVPAAAGLSAFFMYLLELTER